MSVRQFLRREVDTSSSDGLDSHFESLCGAVGSCGRVGERWPAAAVSTVSNTALGVVGSVSDPQQELFPDFYFFATSSSNKYILPA